MTESTESRPAGDDEKRLPNKKEINPFSEQEKHGEEAQRRRPESAQEYQGNTSVQPRSTESEPGTDDADADETENVA